MTQKVFLTGASGYLGAHVLYQLLSKGYSVRASVRSQEKADSILKKYPEYKDKLEFVIVEDVAKDGAFEGKLEGIVGVFHVASPFHFKVTTSNKVDLLDPAIKGTTGILETAAKVPTIKRVVITSSFAAMRNAAYGPDHVYSEADWNPVTQEQAETGEARVAYQASKKLAEKAAYDFVEQRKPQFDVITMNPPYIFGPILHSINKLSDLNESAREFHEVINGKSLDAFAGLFVDVRDVAEAHVLAYEKSVPNQRYFLVGGALSWQEVADVAHKYFPNQTKCQVGTPNSRKPPSFSFDRTKSIAKLGLTYHTSEETFRDSIAQLLEFEKQGL